MLFKSNLSKSLAYSSDGRLVMALNTPAGGIDMNETVLCILKDADGLVSIMVNDDRVRLEILALLNEAVQVLLAEQETAHDGQ